MEVNVGPLTIHYESLGKGKELLFLHGWGGKWESWFPILEHFKANYRVTALDLPGFGKSDTQTLPFGVSDYAKVVAEFIKKICLEKPVVVGHSFGGTVASLLTALYPELVSRLILVDARGFRNKSLKKLALKAVAKTGKAIFSFPILLHVQMAAQNLLYRIIKEEDYLKAGKLKESFKIIVEEDLKPILPSISVPTLIVWGEKDTFTPLSHGKLFHQLIPYSKLVVIPHVGHFSYLENPEMFNEEVEKFLKEM